MYGQAGSPKIKVTPDTIKFGSVHVGKIKMDTFQIHNTSVTSDFLNLNNSKFFNASLKAGSPLSADLYQEATYIPSGGVTREGVRYQPMIRGVDTGSIYVISDATNVPPTPTVFMIGRGINYEILTPGYSFGKIRVGKSSDTVAIPVTNNGDDTTTISSISLTNYGRPRDFVLMPNSLPPLAPNWFLDTLRSNKNTRSFTAYFLPVFDPVNNIIDTGYDTAVVKIVTSDGNTSYDTLSGIGAEPWLIATVPVLDFGTIINPLISSPAVLTLYDTLINKGSMDGILQSLVFSNGSHYVLHAPVANNTPIGESNWLPFAVDFKVDSIGDFFDTIYANNDSRNTPLVLLKAKVRAGIVPINPVYLDTISNCLPVDTTITIYNPNRVNVQISSVYFEGDTGGFELLDTDRTQLQFINFPVFIDGGKSFSLHIRYRFPADSLNGSQTVKIIIARPSGGDNLSLNYDTVLVTLNRKTILLNLSAVMPPYRPSAGDQPFRLPIHLNGDRLRKPELDDDTLRLVFSNKLIQPIGVDRTGSLTESTPTNGVPPQPPPVWDETSSTYSISCVGLHLSSDATKNTLLVTLLCIAYLTKDTTVTITPIIGYTAQPCAYRVAKDSTFLSYANECGDLTIRALLLSSSVPIHLNPPVPDPATLQGSQSVTCTYYAAKDLMLAWKLSDPLGVLVAQEQEVPIRGGDGSFAISLKQIRASGAHYLEVIVRDPETGSHTTISSKFTVIK